MTKTDYLSGRYYVKCGDCYLWVWLGAIKHTMYFSCSDGMIIQPPSGDNLASCEFSDREGISSEEAYLHHLSSWQIYFSI